MYFLRCLMMELPYVQQTIRGHTDSGRLSPCRIVSLTIFDLHHQDHLSRLCPSSLVRQNGIKTSFRTNIYSLYLESFVFSRSLKLMYRFTNTDPFASNSVEGTIGENMDMPFHNGSSNCYFCGYVFIFSIEIQELSSTHRRPHSFL